MSVRNIKGREKLATLKPCLIENKNTAKKEDEKGEEGERAPTKHCM